MAVPSDWVDAAEVITPAFEAPGDAYLGVSGDFDKMGISCGALQWNIGQASFQPLVVAAGKAAVLREMPSFGNALWTACNSPIKQGLEIVRSWQVKTKLKTKPAAELKAFMGCTEMRAEQRKAIENVAGIAFARASAWAKDRDNTEPSKRLFCWFFDIVTQNGGMKGLTPKNVKDFISINTPDRADDFVCDFLAAIPGKVGHPKDARANAKLWRNAASGEMLELLCLSYLRSEKSVKAWRHVVLNRKGTIAMGKGFVNGKKWDLSEHGI